MLAHMLEFVSDRAHQTKGVLIVECIRADLDDAGTKLLPASVPLLRQGRGRSKSLTSSHQR